MTNTKDYTLHLNKEEYDIVIKALQYYAKNHPNRRRFIKQLLSRLTSKNHLIYRGVCEEK